MVHPVSLTAATLDDVHTGLEAKFSIPYLTAYALMRGAPTVQSFRSVDDEVRARRVRVTTDDSLLESEAVLLAGGQEVARVKAAVGRGRKGGLARGRTQVPVQARPSADRV